MAEWAPGLPISETYYEPHWFTGVLKCRCVRCKKVAFGTETAALEAAEKISVRIQMYAYLGQCGHWHLSRTHKRRKRQ